MNIDQLFGGGAFVDQDFVVFPKSQFIDAGLSEIDIATGEQILAGLILIAYRNYFSTNDLENQVIRLLRTVEAPILINDTEKIQYGFNVIFTRDFDNPIFDPDDL